MKFEEMIGPLLVQTDTTLATAESLTGGRLGFLITSVPGASRYYLGGVISYATEAKRDVLGVDGDLLKQHGPVSRETALAMAANVRRMFSASLGVSTTGVAGPDKQDGHPVGTLFIGLASAEETHCFALMAPSGSRDEVQSWAVERALQQVLERLQGISG